VDEVDVFVRVRCAGCARLVDFCESDYRGHEYCGAACRGDAQRESKARHQRSRGGRFDHAARNVDYRARQRASMVPAKFVMDTRSDNLATEASSCVRDDASASAMEAHAYALHEPRPSGLCRSGASSVA